MTNETLKSMGRFGIGKANRVRYRVEQAVVDRATIGEDIVGYESEPQC